MDKPKNPSYPFGDRDVVERTAAVRDARYRWLRVRWERLLSRLVAGARRRRLASLSDRQLRNAGIDLTLAGRGKAVAARPNAGAAGLR